jgi:hypothetical protein
MNKQIISKGKSAVYVQDHIGLKTLYNDINRNDYQINISDLFLKLFYHACQHERKSTIIFLLRIYFELFSQCEQIALRQCFFYGKYKLKKKSMISWYSQYVIPLIKIDL